MDVEIKNKKWPLWFTLCLAAAGAVACLCFILALQNILQSVLQVLLLLLFLLSIFLLYSHRRIHQQMLCDVEKIQDEQKQKNGTMGEVYRMWERNLLTLADANGMFCEWDLTNDRCLRRQGANERLFGQVVEDSIDETIGLCASEMIHSGDQGSFIDFFGREHMLHTFTEGQSFLTKDFRAKTEMGWRWIRTHLHLAPSADGEGVKAFIMFFNVNRDKELELTVRAQMDWDELTGSYMRQAGIQQIQQLLGKPGGTHVLVMLDIDSFKSINDTFGHAFGDRVLHDMGQAMRASLRKQDLLVRMGGDEFLIVLTNVASTLVMEQKAYDLCQRLRLRLSDQILVSMSIGVAMYPKDGIEFYELYRKADSALYQAKRTGKNRFMIYSPELEQSPDGSASASVSEPAVEESQIRSPRRVPVQQIILVMSEQEQVEYFTQTLEDYFEVIVTKTGSQAQTYLERYRETIATVLVDLRIAQENNWHFLNVKQTNANTNAVPVLVVSFDGLTEAMKIAVEHGASDFISMPLDGTAIRLHIESAISRKENEKLRMQNSYLRMHSDMRERTEKVFSATGTGVCVFDWVERTFIYDDVIRSILWGNYDGRPLWQILMSDMVARVTDIQAMQEMAFELANDRSQDSDEMEVMMKTSSGASHWFRYQAVKMRDGLQLTSRMLLIFNDIHKNHEKTVRHLIFRAEHDPLTGLYNSETFYEKATRIVRTKPEGHYAISALDIDQFKIINDQYSNEYGDQILKNIAALLVREMKDCGGIAFRSFGDVFGLLHPYVEGAESPLSVELRDSLKDLLRHDSLSFSVGCFVINDTSLPVSVMFDRAMIAKQSVKHRYDQSFAFFDESMRHELLERREMVSQMEDALNNEEFVMYIQPQYNHETGRLHGGEALVRWVSRTKGMIMPNQFIPTFELNGFIYTLDLYMVERVCRFLRSRLDAGKKAVPISINLSRVDFRRPELCDDIFKHLTKYDLPPELLQFEITETAFALEPEKIMDKVALLRDRGVRISMDDFGSAYSSLNALRDVQVDMIKLDLHFFESGGNLDKRGGVIVGTILDMANSLNLQVLAEGVETRKQADFLLNGGCSLIQGYLYARPMPVEDFEKLIDADVPVILAE